MFFEVEVECFVVGEWVDGVVVVEVYVDEVIIE